MTGLLKKTILGGALAATALTAAAPAEAQWRGGYRGGYRHHNGIGSGGAAVLGGIVGLGLGAAIASSNNNRYYDRGYYNRGYYSGPGPRGYYYDSYPRGYYNDYYDYRPSCFIERRYDPYDGRPINVRVCR